MVAKKYICHEHYKEFVLELIKKFKLIIRTKITVTTNDFRTSSEDLTVMVSSTFKIKLL